MEAALFVVTLGFAAWELVTSELVYHQYYKTRFLAINDIIGHIELDYNEERSAKHCFAVLQDKSCAHSETSIKKGLSYR